MLLRLLAVCCVMAVAQAQQQQQQQLSPSERLAQLQSDVDQQRQQAPVVIRLQPQQQLTQQDYEQALIRQRQAAEADAWAAQQQQAAAGNQQFGSAQQQQFLAAQQQQQQQLQQQQQQQQQQYLAAQQQQLQQQQQQQRQIEAFAAQQPQRPQVPSGIQNQQDSFPTPTLRRVPSQQQQQQSQALTQQQQQQLLGGGAASGQPGGIPSQLTQLLGLHNLGIPGLNGAGAAGGPSAANPFGGLDASQLAAFAAQNPALAQQFLNSAQPLLSAANNPGLNASPGGFPAGFAEAAAAAAGGQALGPNSGILGVFTQLTQKLAQNSGIGDILSQQGALNAASNPSGALGAIFGAAQDPTRAGPSPLGGGGGSNLGIPRLPGLPLLPQGIPKDATGQVDMVKLMSDITKRVTNGTTLSDVLPPTRIQGFADNITDALLPVTPPVDLSKFMGRWFEGINSPRASEQRCVVHHYGGLTDNQKTATFTALKIYREGSEFGQVRYSIGYAFRGGHKDGMLQMHTSESADQTPFWIYKVGEEGEDPFGNPQYEYAIVSNWVKYPVTVLVRDPDVFKQKYEEEVLRYLEDQGFINGFVRAFNMLQPASYQNCQYSDSTFQVFGK